MTHPSASGTRWFAVGALLGILISSGLVAGWHRSSDGLSVTVLGAGRQASVLITFNHRRVLIAAGASGAAFSNAIGNVLPPVDKQLDLVLIDPTSSQDVRERVRALDANLVWTLPDTDEPPLADTVERSFTIDFDDGARLDVSIDPENRWHAELISSAGNVQISPTKASISDVGRRAAVIVLTHDDGTVELDVPLIISVAGTSVMSGQQLRLVGPGSSVRLELDDHEIRLESD